MSRIVLMSVHPRFVDMIFSGEKTFELRRQCAGLSAGDLVYVYSTSPEMALRGYFVVDYVAFESLALLWGRVRGRAGVSRRQFDDYFHGKDRGFAISVREKKLVAPVPLAALRKIWPSFHPPQSYRFLAASDALRLGRLQGISERMLRGCSVREQIGLPL